MNNPMTSVLAKNKLLFSFARISRQSFSEEGEDILVSNFFDKSYKGFYVDIGNFDKMYSNTYSFYKNGWKGLNIYCKPFENRISPIRPRDINIYQNIEGIKLAQIFKSQLPPKNGFLSDCIDIDILNIDATGNELKIILSNNWKIFRPNIIMITDYDSEGINMFTSDSIVYQNLWSNNYILIAKTSKTIIFREINFLKKVMEMKKNILLNNLAT